MKDCYLTYDEIFDTIKQTTKDWEREKIATSQAIDGSMVSYFR